LTPHSAMIKSPTESLLFAVRMTKPGHDSACGLRPRLR
jgi:hypothetical protein